MIELLIVLIVIGLLAAIATPALLGQTTKADDAAAKRQVRAAAKAAEVVALASGGYAAVSLASLRGVEPSLGERGDATLQAPAASTSGYKVGSKANATGDIFYIARGASGTWTRTCKVATPTKAGGCSRLIGRNGTW